MEKNLNKELEKAMDNLGIEMVDIPEEFLEETPDEEVHYILEGGELHEE